MDTGAFTSDFHGVPAPRVVPEMRLEDLGGLDTDVHRRSADVSSDSQILSSETRTSTTLVSRIQQTIYALILVAVAGGSKDYVKVCLLAALPFLLIKISRLRLSRAYVASMVVILIYAPVTIANGHAPWLSLSVFSLFCFGALLAHLSADELRGVLLGYVLGVVSLFVLSLVGLVGSSSDSLDQYGYRGWTAHKNIFGYTMAFGCVCLASGLARTRRRGRLADRVLQLGLLLGTLAAVVMSNSVGSLVSLAAGLSVVALKMHRSRQRLRVPGFGRLALIGALGLVVGFRAAILNWLGRDTSGAGRSTVWAVVSDRLSERVVVGDGVGSNWSFGNPVSPLTLQVRRMSGQQITSSHNTFLELGISFGLIAGAIGSLILLSSTWRAIRLQRTTAALSAFGVVAMMVESFVTLPLLAILGGLVVASQSIPQDRR